MKLNFLPAFACIATLTTAVSEETKVSLRYPEGASQPYETATPENLKRLMAIAHRLEDTPFARGATTDREWALYMIDHDPHIFPRIQTRIVPTITASESPDHRVVYTQFYLGFVAFQLEHPERRDDPTAVYTAALTSCLRAYRHAIKRDSQNRIAFLDTAIEHERDGTLARFVEEQFPYGMKDYDKQ